MLLVLFLLLVSRLPLFPLLYFLPPFSSLLLLLFLLLFLLLTSMIDRSKKRDVNVCSLERSCSKTSKFIVIIAHYSYFLFDSFRMMIMNIGALAELLYNAELGASVE